MNNAHNKTFQERKEIVTRAGKARRSSVTLSSVLTSNPGLHIDNKIMCVERFITNIDSVRPRHRSVEILYLSNNCISSLTGISQFTQLRVLSLNNNLIEDFQELQPLVSLKNLEVLSLVGNMVSYLPFYRHCVINLVPHIVTLDAKRVPKAELDTSPQISKIEHQLVKTMWRIEVLVARIGLGKRTMQLRRAIKGGAAAGPNTQTMAGEYLKKLASLIYIDTRDKSVRHSLYANYRGVAYKILSERMPSNKAAPADSSITINEHTKLYNTIIHQLLSEAIQSLAEMGRGTSSGTTTRPHIENCLRALSSLPSPVFPDDQSFTSYFNGVKFITFTLVFILYRITPQKHFRSMVHFSQTLIGLKTYGPNCSLEYNDRLYERIKHMDFLRNSFELKEPTDNPSLEDFVNSMGGNFGALHSASPKTHNNNNNNNKDTAYTPAKVEYKVEPLISKQQETDKESDVPTEQSWDEGSDVLRRLSEVKEEDGEEEDEKEELGSRTDSEDKETEQPNVKQNQIQNKDNPNGSGKGGDNRAQGKGPSEFELLEQLDRITRVPSLALIANGKTEDERSPSYSFDSSTQIKTSHNSSNSPIGQRETGLIAKGSSSAQKTKTPKRADRSPSPNSDIKRGQELKKTTGDLSASPIGGSLCCKSASPNKQRTLTDSSTPDINQRTPGPRPRENNIVCINPERTPEGDDSLSKIAGMDPVQVFQDDFQLVNTEEIIHQDSEHDLSDLTRSGAKDAAASLAEEGTKETEATITGHKNTEGNNSENEEEGGEEEKEEEEEEQEQGREEEEEQEEETQIQDDIRPLLVEEPAVLRHSSSPGRAVPVNNEAISTERQTTPKLSPNRLVYEGPVGSTTPLIPQETNRSKDVANFTPETQDPTTLRGSGRPPPDTAHAQEGLDVLVALLQKTFEFINKPKELQPSQGDMTSANQANTHQSMHLNDLSCSPLGEDSLRNDPDVTVQYASAVERDCESGKDNTADVEELSYLGSKDGDPVYTISPNKRRRSNSSFGCCDDTPDLCGGEHSELVAVYDSHETKKLRKIRCLRALKKTLEEPLTLPIMIPECVPFPLGWNDRSSHSDVSVATSDNTKPNTISSEHPSTLSTTISNAAVDKQTPAADGEEESEPSVINVRKGNMDSETTHRNSSSLQQQDSHMSSVTLPHWGRLGGGETADLDTHIGRRGPSLLALNLIKRITSVSDSMKARTLLFRCFAQMRRRAQVLGETEQVLAHTHNLRLGHSVFVAWQDITTKVEQVGRRTHPQLSLPTGMTRRLHTRHILRVSFSLMRDILRVKRVHAANEVTVARWRRRRIARSTFFILLTRINQIIRSKLGDSMSLSKSPLPQSSVSVSANRHSSKSGRHSQFSLIEREPYENPNSLPFAIRLRLSDILSSLNSIHIPQDNTGDTQSTISHQTLLDLDDLKDEIALLKQNLLTKTESTK